MAASRTRVATLALADATLSSGAVLSAAGGGLPQRVAHPDKKTFDFVGASSEYTGLCFDDDGNVWVSEYAGTASLRRYDQDGNVLDAFAGLGYQMQISRVPDAPVFLLTRSQNKIIEERNVATGAVVTSTGVSAQAGNPCNAWKFPSGKYWVAFVGSPILREWTPGGAATGRTLTAGGNGSIASEGSYIYAPANGNGWGRYRDSDLVLEETFETEIANYSNRIGSHYHAGYNKHCCVDRAGKVYIGSLFGDIQSWTPDGVFEQRAIWASDRHSLESWIPATSVGRNPCFNDDESLFAIVGPRRNGVPSTNIYLGSVHIFKTDTARATFTRLFSTAATLTYILVPGSLGNERDATFDDRKTRLYYSTNGVDFTEFTPGSPLSVALAAGTTLTVRCEMSTWAKPTGTPPWIGGDAGEGISLIYTEDDPHGPDATVTVSTPAAIGVTVAAPPRITVTVRS